jgi:hypothetical protein
MYYRTKQQPLGNNFFTNQPNNQDLTKVVDASSGQQHTAKSQNTSIVLND